MISRSSLITIIALFLLALRFQRDFKRDPGLHKNAKIFQVILLSCLIFNYASSIPYLGWLLGNFDLAWSRFSFPVGIVPGYLHFAIFILNLVGTAAILVICFLMASRNLKARQLFFWVLPVLALTETFSYYRGFSKMGENLDYPHALIFLLGLLIFGGITAANLIIYRSKFMVSFFYLTTEPTEQEEEKDILDDMDLSDNS